jgi:hypothetical protein
MLSIEEKAKPQGDNKEPAPIICLKEIFPYDTINSEEIEMATFGCTG